MTTKRAAIYLRVSTDTQEVNGTSLITQEERCLEYCLQREYSVEQQYIYKDSWTGAEYRGRPGLTVLREDARKKQFDIVIIYAFDRLARKQVHQAVIIEDLQQQNVSVESVTEDFDESTIGQFLRNASAFAAELEHKKIIERTQRGRKAKLEAGKLLGTGLPAYGYEWNKDKSAYTINTDEAKTVKLIFKLYVEEHYSVYAITLYLLENGLSNRKEGNGQWVAGTVARILRNPYYIGKGFSHKWDCAGGGLKRRSIEEYIPLADNIVPAIIDEETFKKAQDRLTVNKQSSSENNRNPELSLLYSGYVVCGGCGRNLVVKPSAVLGGYSYVCNRGVDRGRKCNEASISVANLDHMVWKYVETILYDEAKLDQRLADIVASLTTSEVDMEPIESQIDEIERQQKKCALGIARAKDEYTIELLSGELEVLARTRKELEDMKNKVLDEDARKAEVRSKLYRFKNEWTSKAPSLSDSSKYRDKRDAVEILGIRVTVFNMRHEPRYTIKMVPPKIVFLSSSC